MEFKVSSGFDWWALKLTAACVVVFGLSQVMPEFFYGNFPLVSSKVLIEPWRILTHIFMHGDFQHLYFNMFSLAVFGSIFEKQVGSRTFLMVFFLGGLASSVADVMFYPSTVGASGAIFAVLGGLAIFRPKTVVWAMGAPMYVLVAFFIWMAIDLLGFFQPDNIAHASHLAGMTYGGAYGYYLRRQFPEEKPSKRDHDGLPTEKELDEWEQEYMVKN